MWRRVAMTFMPVLLASALPGSLAAQPTCNHCGQPPECYLFRHWDNCGFAGPGLAWEGFCASGACHELDCSVHWGSPCGGDPMYHPTNLASISGDLEGSAAVPRWALRAAAEVLKINISDDVALPHRVRWKPDEGVLFWLGCDGSTLLARVPLGRDPRPSRLVAMVLAVIPRRAEG
jgi:hypothetical protein